MQNPTADCPLCTGKANSFYQQDTRHFFQCTICYGIFLEQGLRLNPAEEVARYKLHKNDIEDKKYQQFVLPITQAVINYFTKNHKGLDFGAGTGPVISKVLTDEKFQISPYDPYFHNYPDLLKSSYDYITCCEVIEHFYKPKKEFELLKKLLKPKGKLYLMTALFDETINFHKWYYKNDPTHVFIYHQKTMRWIKEKFTFTAVSIQGRLITFSN